MAKPVVGQIVSDEIKLDIWDEEGDTWVRFVQPGRLEEEVLARMRAKAELVWSTEEQGTVRQRDTVPLMTQESEMVALCLCESNLPNEKGDLIFRSGVNCRTTTKAITGVQKERFYQAWYSLSGPLCEEIVAKLVDWYPPFDFRNPERGEE